MISLAPLKPFERIWDRVEKSKLPKWLKAFLLTLDALSMIFISFSWFFLAKQIVDMIGALFGFSP
jgi:hypothetical protein